MPTVSGTVFFDIDRNINPSGNVVGIVNIPVVLQNIITQEYVAVNTDAAGSYAFINVPAGEYKIVEIYGFPGAVASPGDFTTAVIGTIPSALNPPVGAIPSAPIGATHIDCVTPNTINITVAAADVTDQYIFNGPVRYTPIRVNLDACTFVFPRNIIEDADFGTFGFFPDGTPANTGLTINPYPIISPDFTYVLPDPSDYTPFDGEYTLQNIMNNAMSNQIGAWWRISDHTAGNETGRMMIVNGYDGTHQAVIIREVVPVSPYTSYLFSAWILNLFRVSGYTPPQFGVRILDEDGFILYNSSLGFEIPENSVVPEWKEIGTVINSRDNTVLTFEFISEGEAAIGNDFAFDDISLRQVRIPEIAPIKFVDRDVVTVGETVTYTVTLNNFCDQPLMDVFFQDQMPVGQEFVFGSVIVNGVPEPAVNPYTGFYLPWVNGGDTATVQFQAVITEVPAINPFVNSALIRYLYSPIAGGIADVYTYQTNEVPVYVNTSDANEADLSVTKTARRRCISSNDTVSYTMNVRNNGASIAENVVVTDVLPAQFMNAVYSADNCVTWQPWLRDYNMGNLLPNECRKIVIRSEIAADSCGCVYNTAYVTSDTPDYNTSNNQCTEMIRVTPNRFRC